CARSSARTASTTPSGETARKLEPSAAGVTLSKIIEACPLRLHWPAAASVTCARSGNTTTRIEGAARSNASKSVMAPSLVLVEAVALGPPQRVDVADHLLAAGRQL